MSLRVRRLNIGPRLVLGFGLIIAAMLAADAVVLWQFRVVRAQAERLIDIDQAHVAVLRVHSGLLAFHDRLDALADSEDFTRLEAEAGTLRTSVQEDIRQATSAVSALPGELQRDPTILPTLRVIQSTLQSQLEAITPLAQAGDWTAVHLRLSNQIRPLASVTSTLVEKVDQEVGAMQAQTALNLRRIQQRVFVVLPLTAVLTLLIAGAMGLAITRSITRPLDQLVVGSRALARGEFEHHVAISGDDELARLGHVFNEAAVRLNDLYATLQNREDRLRRVVDTIPAHAWSSLPDGSVDFVNQRFLDFAGRSGEELLGWGWAAVIHPDDRTGFLDQWRGAVASGEAIESLGRVRRADGDYRWLLIRNVPFRDESGIISNWYGSATDITELHVAEEALRRSEGALLEAQQISHTGSWRWKINSGEVALSAELGRILGMDPAGPLPPADELIAMTHPDDRPTFQGVLEQAVRERIRFEYEYRIVLRDGTTRRLHIVGHPDLALPEELEYTGVVMDITERRHAEEALRDAREELARVSQLTTMGEFAASIAHEINQPLAAIVSQGGAGLRWLKRETPDVDEASEAFAQIVNNGQRAADVIRGLRALAKKSALQLAAFDIDDTIGDVLALTQSEVQRQGIVLHIDLAVGDQPVVGDRGQLQQVLLNLILNAIDAMKAVTDRARELAISSAVTDSGSVMITVGDTGSGVDPAIAERVFEPFVTTKPDGLGMGLSICRSIIVAHGGRLWASPNVPHGTCFHFTVPIGVAT